MVEGDEVFELGLDDLVGPLALLCNSVVANIAFAVNYESKRVAGGSLYRC